MKYLKPEPTPDDKRAAYAELRRLARSEPLTIGEAVRVSLLQLDK